MCARVYAYISMYGAYMYMHMYVHTFLSPLSLESPGHPRREDQQQTCHLQGGDGMAKPQLLSLGSKVLVGNANSAEFCGTGLLRLSSSANKLLPAGGGRMMGRGERGGD